MISSFFNGILNLFGLSRNTKILLLGLDGAGKTLIMYKIKVNDEATTIPIVCSSVDQISYKNFNVVSWDLGGGNQFYNMRNHSTGTDAIIFVVESNDRERMNDAKKELLDLCAHQSLKDIPLLVFANKQDMQNAMSVDEITDLLDLHSIKDRKWYIQPCSAINIQGIHEGFEWISNALKQ